MKKFGTGLMEVHTSMFVVITVYGQRRSLDIDRNMLEFGGMSPEDAKDFVETGLMKTEKGISETYIDSRFTQTRTHLAVSCVPACVSRQSRGDSPPSCSFFERIGD